jgi:hypothetical protein
VNLRHGQMTHDCVAAAVAAQMWWCAAADVADKCGGALLLM